MLTQYYFLVSLSLCLSYAEIITWEEMFNKNVQEGSCDDKINVALSILKFIPEKIEKTIERKLYALEKKIPEKLEEYFDCKLDVLENLEDNIDRKLFKLEKKLLDRLEMFMDRKLDALEINNVDKVKENIEHKLDALEKKISDIDENINIKFDTLANKAVGKNEDDLNRNKDMIEKIPVLENSTVNCKTDGLDQKIPESKTKIEHKLEELEKKIFNLNNDPDKLDEDIERKLKELEKKIFDLNKNPDKVEENIERKLEVLGKKISDIDENIERKFETLVNRTLGKNYDDINRKLDTIEKIPDLENITKRCSTVVLDKKVSDLEVNVNHKLEASAKLIPELETTIVRKLNALERKVPERFDENISSKLNLLEKKILDLKLNTHNKLSLLETKLSDKEKDIGNKLDVIQRKIPDFQDNVNKKFYALQSTEKKMFEELRRAQDTLLCKEVVVRGYNYKPLSRIDNATLNHVMLKIDSGGLMNFEMRISIKAAKEAIILLSPLCEPRLSDRVYEIVLGVGGYNDRTQLRLNLMDNLAQDKITPNILSATHFTSFTIQISNGKLIFNQDGFLPSILHSDSLLNSVRYFGFASWGENQATILYDCPAQNF